MIYSKNKLCNVRDHGEQGEVAAICNRCFDLALVQQTKQRQAEQKVEHQEWLAKKYRHAA